MMWRDKSDVRRWGFWCILFVVFFFLCGLRVSAKRLLWNDEVFTAALARVPDVRTLWRAIADYADSMPFGYHLLIRATTRIFGYSALALRLPSAVALAAGMLLTFDCARRLTSGFHAMISLALLGCSFVRFYGYEARPYTLIFAIASFCLWLWLFVDESWLSALAFGFAAFLAVAMHLYAVVLIVPYAVYEILRTKSIPVTSRRLVAGGIGTLGGTLLACQHIFAGLEGVRISSRIPAISWAPPTFQALEQVWTDCVPIAALALVLLVLSFALWRAEKPSMHEPMGDGERLCWMFLLVPLSGFALAIGITHIFHARYFIEVVPGIAVGTSCMLFRLCPNRRILWGLLLLFLGLGLRSQVKAALHPESIQSFGDYQTLAPGIIGMEPRFASEGKRYIVFSDDNNLCLVAWYYSAHRDRYAVVSRGPFALARYTADFNVWTPEELVAHTDESALVSPKPELTDYLLRAGLRVEVRAASPTVVVYTSRVNHSPNIALP